MFISGKNTDIYITQGVSHVIYLLFGFSLRHNSAGFINLGYVKRILGRGVGIFDPPSSGSSLE